MNEKEMKLYGQLEKDMLLPFADGDIDAMNAAVVVHHLIAKGTLDEKVMAALEKKDCGQSALVEAVKARIGGRRDGCGEIV